MGRRVGKFHDDLCPATPYVKALVPDAEEVVKGGLVPKPPVAVTQTAAVVGDDDSTLGDELADLRYLRIGERDHKEQHQDPGA